MSNDEILTFFKNQKQEVCGRIRNENFTSPTIPTKLKRFLVAFALAFLPFWGLAQTNLDTITLEKINAQEVPQQKQIIKPSIKPVVIKLQSGINGKLRNKKGAPIAHAKIIARKDGIITQSAISDSNGHYTLLPMAPGQYELTFSSAGYKTTILVNAIVQKGYEWPLTVIMHDYKPKSKATHDTREAPINYGRQGPPCTIGMVKMKSEPPRYPTNSVNYIINKTFNLD